jgi:ABC-type transport system involved in cytochrome bd biosynthesis fused ATPase/permease subunit
VLTCVLTVYRFALHPTLQDMPGGLDAVVAEGGSNFSLGQKQLVSVTERCLLPAAGQQVSKHQPQVSGSEN